MRRRPISHKPAARRCAAGIRSYAPGRGVRPVRLGPDDDIARLRSENEEMHKLIEEMKQIFEQASTQEETNSRASRNLEPGLPNWSGRSTIGTTTSPC